MHLHINRKHDDDDDDGDDDETFLYNALLVSRKSKILYKYT